MSATARTDPASGGRPAARRRRWRAVTAAIILVLCGLAAAAWTWIDASSPRHAGEIRVAGLSAPLRVVRDANGVPHVFAAQVDDLHLAQGFVHAQDRFAQMDAMRMLARGRLAELIGTPGLANDRFMRGMGLVERAERALEALSAPSRAALDAYARGVNAFLADPAVRLPLETRLAGRRPEPWHPVDSLLWGEVMALHLSGNWRDELGRMRMIAAGHDRQILQLLWPEWPADTATSLAAAQTIPWDLSRLEIAGAALPPTPVPPHASNAWVFSGARTTSGKPLLANDPHLQLGAPGVWYLVRLEAPGFLRVGASAPGVPGIVLGHNGHVAWGMTTTGADSFDLVVERLMADDETRYDTPSGPQPFDVRHHEIIVKGDARPTRVAIRRTRHGPVLADLLGTPEAAPQGHVLALRAVLDHGTNTTADALLRMTDARDLSGLLSAARGWRAPVQNLFVADVTGRIALAVIGAVPKRRGHDGSLPTPGWDDRHGWSGLVPADAMPQRVDPAAGFLMNANNRLVAEDADVFLTVDWDAPYRARRLHRGIADAPKQDAATAAAMQFDNVSDFARDVIRASASWAPADSEIGVLMTRLRAWGGEMRRDLVEPTIFNAWMRALRREASVRLFGAADVAGREAPALALAIASGDPRACARLDCAALMESTLREALSGLRAAFGSRIEDWTWGRTHVATFENPVWKSVPGLARIFGFSIPADGDNFTVNRGTPRQTDPAAFPVVHGPGLRAIYDLSDLSASRFMITPGQSGHPLSKHWGDLAERWADGRYLSISGDRENLSKHGVVLDLHPGRHP